MIYPFKKKKGVNIYLLLLHLFFEYFPQEYVICKRNVFSGSGFQYIEHLGGEWETFMSRTLKRLGDARRLFWKTSLELTPDSGLHRNQSPNLKDKTETSRAMHLMLTGC